MLHVEARNFKIGRRLLTATLNVSVSAGSIKLLQGPNGCGKSLLLDVISGIHRSQAVTTRLNGVHLDGHNAYSRWHGGLRRMFQYPAVPSELTVHQLLKHFEIEVTPPGFCSEALRLLREGDIRVNEAFGIHSFGQQRLIELVIALSSGRCHLLDEPFAGIEPLLHAPASALIKERAEAGNAFLIIDHLSDQRLGLYDGVYAWNLPHVNERASPLRPSSHISSDFRSLATHNSVYWSIAHFSIDGRTLLKDAHIVLPSGTILLLVGGNGSGKSTLLRELGGYSQPWRGVSAELTRSVPMEELFLSPQPPKLVDELTTEENLALMICKGSTMKKSVLATAKSLLDSIGFPSAYMKARAEVLSGGEASMVALVGAVLSPAKILFLDEPFESLSPKSLRYALEMLKSAMAVGKSVLATTHNAELMATADASQVIHLTGQVGLSGHWTGGSVNALTSLWKESSYE
jgi:ABC-type multidrug transport system ATPase subunit